MNSTAIFNAAIEIARLTNSILQLIHLGADQSFIQAHFETIGKIAAINAAKPEIEGFAEHE
jgi:hypothetical protein